MTNFASYYKDVYDDFFSIAGWFHRVRTRELIEAIGKHDNILDVGGGSGVLADALELLGKYVSVTDADIRRVRYMRRNGLNAVQHDIVKMRVRDKFEVVVCADVLEHFGELERLRALRHLADAVDVKGKLILMFPTAQYILGIDPIWKWIRKGEHDDETHFVVSDCQVIKFLTSRGFILVMKKLVALNNEVLLVFKREGVD